VVEYRLINVKKSLFKRYNIPKLQYSLRGVGLKGGRPLGAKPPKFINIKESRDASE